MFDHFEAEADSILDEQIRICEIAAPTGQEAARAAYVAEQLDRIGLTVTHDAVGNVIGRPESMADDPVVLSAHLDTVFGADQPVAVARPGESNPYRDGEAVPEGEYHAPGISDAAAGLVAMLTIARSVRQMPWASEMMFVATVGEEGRGDLRGARHFFETERGRNARAFITIDHSDPAAVVNGGIGSRRYSVQYRGSGGHSWGHFGRYNPAFALAAAADRLAEIRVPRSPRTSYNVGVVRGGETVNAIPEFAEMDIDLRSESPEQLERLDEDVQEIIRRGHQRELRRRSEGAIEPLINKIGDRPAGLTPLDSALVRAACQALQAEGLPPRTIAASTDANAAMAAGVPAVAMSWGGKSDNQHSVREWFDPTARSRSLRVIARMLLELAQQPAD